ncbi:MAG: ferredoxin [Nitrospiraceae bacterium]|nr:ferredoxin [Nitrospiraceae bacterium]
MKVPVIDFEACEGCGTCEAMCPEVFKVKEDGKAYVINPEGCKTCNCQEAADSCPVECIKMEEQ